MPIIDERSDFSDEVQPFDNTNSKSARKGSVFILSGLKYLFKFFRASDKKIPKESSCWRYM